MPNDLKITVHQIISDILGITIDDIHDSDYLFLDLNASIQESLTIKEKLEKEFDVILIDFSQTDIAVADLIEIIYDLTL